MPAATPDPLPVSVVIPAYNRPADTARAVRSALSQRPRPAAEVIVVDDCSTDDTAAEAEAAGARVVRRERNGGESASRNSGVAAASQPWIATLDSDDAWLPTHLATVWAAVAESVVLVSSSALACGDDPAEDTAWGVAERLDLRSPADVVAVMNPVVVSGALFRRDAALAAGLFAEGMKRCADFDLWLRLLEHGRGVVLPDVTVLYAVHPTQVSSDRGAMRSATREVAAAYRDRPWWSERAAQRLEGVLHWDGLRQALSAGDRADARRELRALLDRPTTVAGAIAIVRDRERARRVGSLVARTGAPAVLVASDAKAAAPWATERFGDAARVSDRTGWREAVGLWRGPPACVVTGSWVLRRLARGRGVTTLDGPGGD